ncbi:MAG: phage tail sheath C-terminal domain-containing protein, partial [Bacteroidota bacterium]
EYEDSFGPSFEYKYKIDNPSSNPVITPLTNSDVEIGTFYLYEALQAYFLNGGGPCYVISVGDFDDTPEESRFINELEIVERLDEPTLILFPEAAGIAGDQNTTANVKYGSIASEALKVAAKSGDKFVILDTPAGENLTDHTTASDFRTSLGTSDLNRGAVYFPHLELVNSFQFHESSTYGGSPISQLRGSGSDEYAKAVALLKDFGRITMPPSACLAGIYAATDRAQGVWKAPANVSIQGLIQPSIATSDSMQNDLNIDATSGKSINVIRTFAGLGTKVWGARTLAGNDNEWRYISVRRLFLSVEESIKKAVSQFVFENNDARTWVKVSAMIKSYLNGIWQEGGLQGVTDKEAFFVNVGFGQTMSEVDILEGRMIVKVGLAAVRPAEFIVLEFSHYLNQ